MGLVSQVVTRFWTGYMDVLPPQMLLGAALCLGAGWLVRINDPLASRPRHGALAGIGMVASIVAGYLVLIPILWNPVWAAGDGETWWSLLIEAPIWIGMPLLTGAVCGGLGWHLARWWESRARPTAHPR
jgi:hypothetical protein